MMTTSASLRKAAILLRSLDSDTAAILLAQFSAEQAASIRAAIRELGPLDPEEQADVAAEFHRTRPATAARSTGGVELELSSPIGSETFAGADGIDAPDGSTKRFDFLASASTAALVRYLAREHAQTIAVVLAHLAPARAAAVLAALPEKLQTDTIERLSVLGETDSETVNVLERELGAWLATRAEDRGTIARRRETVANILAATDPKTRRGIVNNLKSRNGVLAEQIAPEQPATTVTGAKPAAARRHYESKQAVDTSTSIQRGLARSPQARPSLQPATEAPEPLPRIEFDQLVHLDTQSLNVLLRDVNANVLAIALTGSREELIDRICGQMPKRTGRAFRRELRRLGPLRLSDIEAAQLVVAESAARQLTQRQPSLAIARG